MYGDFSRDVTAPPDGYRRVLMQQGRVLLDADYNDQIGMLLRYQEQLIKALTMAPGVLTADTGLSYATTGDNFSITAVDGDPDSVSVKAGWYFVGGLLATARDNQKLSIKELRARAKEHRAALKASARYFWLYLDVWEQCVAAAEDEGYTFREPALKGADTALHTKVMHRVSLEPLDEQTFRTFLADPAPEAAATKTRLLEYGGVKKLDQDITIPELQLQDITQPDDFWYRLMVALGGIVPLLTLIVLSVARQSWPNFFDLAVTAAFALVAVALFQQKALPKQLTGLPAQLHTQQHNQQEKLNEFLKGVREGVKAWAEKLENSQQSVITRHKGLVNLVAQEFTEPRRREEITRNIQGMFAAHVALKRDPLPKLEVRDSRGIGEDEQTRYHGLESRLYRVEIHSAGGDKPACFKWSRDNGYLVFNVVAGATDTEPPTITIEAPQLDSKEIIDHWVELLPAEQTDTVRSSLPSTLRKVKGFETKVGTNTAKLILDRQAKPPKLVRVWGTWNLLDSSATGAADDRYGAIPIVEGEQALDDGLSIKFTGPASAYRPGDYWLIKVRPDQKLEYKVEAQSEQHYYAPLAIVEADADDSTNIYDCRLLIASLGCLSDEAVEKFAPLKGAPTTQQSSVSPAVDVA